MTAGKTIIVIVSVLRTNEFGHFISPKHDASNMLVTINYDFQTDWTLYRHWEFAVVFHIAELRTSSSFILRLN